MLGVLQNTSKASATGTWLKLPAKLWSWPVCMTISGAIHGEKPFMACKLSSKLETNKQMNERTGHRDAGYGRKPYKKQDQIQNT